MDRVEILERIASGLRRLNKAPDALVYIINDKIVWAGDKTIFNIPLYYCGEGGVIYYSTPYAQLCPFIPIYLSEITRQDFFNLYQFADGFFSYKKEEL